VNGPDPHYRGFQEQASMVRDDALDLVESAFRWIHDGLAGGDYDAEIAAVLMLSDVDQGVPLHGVLSTLLILADRAAAEQDAEYPHARAAAMR
jgi:hypothetical protein